MEKIACLSISELSQLIREKQLSPVEVTEVYLDRIDRLNSRYNAYITVCQEEALLAAKEAEKAIALGRYLGPMHGIPVAVKDQILTKGVRTTGGSPILNDFIPDEDAGVMAKLKAAGAILLGKLNMSEFTVESVRHFYGTPRNPWDLDRNPGISSSGSGAAVAACLCGTSLGEDTGGSIRLPAALCGVVGFRPTWGRVSRHGILGVSWSLDIAGPISRTVADCAMTLQVIAGYDTKDPYTWDVPVPEYHRALSGNIKGMRVGVVNELLDGTPDAIDAEVKEAVINAISSLENQGAIVKRIPLPLIRHSSVVLRILSMVESSALYREMTEKHRNEYNHDVQVRRLTGALVPAQTYYKAQGLRNLVRRQMLKALQEVDVLALPVTSMPAPLIDSREGISSNEEAVARLRGSRSFGSFTSSAALAGLPAISVPCGFTGQNLPIGFQIVGPPFAEETVLNVAYAYEQNSDWHRQRPPF